MALRRAGLPSVSTTRSSASSLLPSRRYARQSPLYAAMSSRASSSSTDLPSSPFPIFATIADFRRWRRYARREAYIEPSSASSQTPPSTKAGSTQADEDPESVGFVPTMGALHAGHLDLVRHSLRENRHTVVSIFVNPAQFAPTEDLASYPRTLPSDIAKLQTLEEEVQRSAKTSSQPIGKISAIFCPSVKEMYPPLPGTDTPFTQEVKDQRGAFIEVQGLSNVLEGKSRPGFFRGVATVVTKLWHIIEPTKVYFGQKDIQQALILRALLSSLLFQYPSSSSYTDSFRLVQTQRDPTDGLALSSRNAYLSVEARKRAGVLYKALQAGKEVFERGSQAQTTIEAAQAVVKQAVAELSAEQDQHGIGFELDYLSLNSMDTLQELSSTSSTTAQPSSPSDETTPSKAAVLSGALWIIDNKDLSGPNGTPRRTRMIDNLILGKDAGIELLV